jgi:hypothetical protein
MKRVHFQYLEDKAVARISPLNGIYFNIARRLALVKSVLISQSIYPLTTLHVPVEPLQTVVKFIRSFFWPGTEQVYGGKCKVNWTAVCRPTSLGGLGILNMEKFARALRLCWPWLAWASPDRPWVGMKNPCNKDDMELFYAFTSMIIGNGTKASFWEDSWVDGISPKVLALSVYAISRQKTWSVSKAINDKPWVRQLDISVGLNVQQLQEFGVVPSRLPPCF